MPPVSSRIARFANEVVLGEESDLGPDGKPISHFESRSVDQLASGINAGLHVGDTLPPCLFPRRLVFNVRHSLER
jgi:hypothetical protein